MIEAIKGYALLFVFTLVSPFGVNIATEEPSYRVVEKLSGGVEIREYGKRIAAEVTVEESDPDKARRKAFDLLAGYIFGENRQKQSVAMTAPVEIETRGREIAMTSPVEVDYRGGAMTMRFFMPASYGMRDLPEPGNAKVKLDEAPAETMAVLRYSGSTKDEVVTAQSAALLEALQKSRWNATKEVKAFFYNPPWTIPFLRRNEVVVEVARREPA